MKADWTRHVSVMAIVAASFAWPGAAEADPLVVTGEMSLSGGHYVYDYVLIEATGSLVLTGDVTIVCNGYGTGFFRLLGGTIGNPVFPASFDPTDGQDGQHGANGVYRDKVGKPGVNGQSIEVAEGTSGYRLIVRTVGDIVLKGSLDMRGSIGTHYTAQAGNGGNGGNGGPPNRYPGAGGSGGAGGDGGNGAGGEGGTGGRAVFLSLGGIIDGGDGPEHGVFALGGGDGGRGGQGGDGGDGGTAGGSPGLPGSPGGDGGNGGDSQGGRGGNGGSALLRARIVRWSNLETDFSGGQGGLGGVAGQGGSGGLGGGGRTSGPDGRDGGPGRTDTGPYGTDGAISVIDGEEALWDVTWPGDLTVGTSANFPGGDHPPGPFGPESPDEAIDNDPATKYLNFDKGNSGLLVTPAIGPTRLARISLTTANDSPDRDPASVTILGSNDGGDWMPVVTDLPIPLPDGRFQETAFSFDSETPGFFTTYKVTFPTLKDTNAANSMQIAEIQLIGDVPEPATLSLLALAPLAMLRRRPPTTSLAGRRR